MTLDLNVQVWLDTYVQAGQTILVPHVRVEHGMRLRYRVDVLQQSRNGKSRINQQGEVDVPAGADTSLSRLSLTLDASRECSVELTLHDRERKVGVFRFEC